jgi:hypothetical protein
MTWVRDQGWNKRKAEQQGQNTLRQQPLTDFVKKVYPIWFRRELL